MSPFEIALRRIDAANAEDPSRVTVAGEARPAELVYSERMSAMLDRFVPDASAALRLAARAQHLRRWAIPRDSYPMDRAGYHRWRGELKRKHAEWAGDILAASGVDDETTARTASLIRKENLKTDPESQALEDVACLVFLEHYAAGFAARHDRDKMIDILRKTWRKMSDAGHAAALTLPLDPAVRGLVADALGAAAGPAVRTPVPAADIAVLLAAHGDRGGDSPNATLLGHCAALHALGLFRSVHAGILRGEPVLEESVRAALATGARRLAVYPMFMADGYFTRQVLTQRLAALEMPIDVHILPPLGADPRLPGLMLAQALAAAESAGLEPQSSRLLVVGHGSKIGPASADATRAVAAAMAKEGRFATVETAFLEEAEFLADALARAAGPTVVSGFFSGDGLHAAEDVPEAIAEAGANAADGAGAEAVYAGSIGTSPALVDLIRSSIAAELGAT
jgi:sirohydrochlorin ferrochelatase